MSQSIPNAIKSGPSLNTSMFSLLNKFAQGPGLSGPINLPFSITKTPSTSIYPPFRSPIIIKNIFIVLLKFRFTCASVSGSALVLFCIYSVVRSTALHCTFFFLHRLTRLYQLVPTTFHQFCHQIQIEFRTFDTQM